MTQTDSVTTTRPQLGTRTGSSRKLLMRKAEEKIAGSITTGGALEACFPAANSPAEPDAPAGRAETCGVDASADYLDPTAIPAMALVGSTSAATPMPAAEASPAAHAHAAPPAPAPAPAWSPEDESTFQTLLARRKAAGYQRRGRDVSRQVITLGSITPNADTVVAVIVGIVAGSGSIARADLVDAMAKVTFPHAKAQPTDKGWCQGYVAGAVRNGFLELVDQSATVVEAA